jgi:hypothetical protein
MLFARGFVRFTIPAAPARGLRRLQGRGMVAQQGAAAAHGVVRSRIVLGASRGSEGAVASVWGGGALPGEFAPCGCRREEARRRDFFQLGVGSDGEGKGGPVAGKWGRVCAGGV